MDKEKVFKLFKEGYSNTQIAKELNCSVSNISSFLKRNSLKNTWQRSYRKEDFMKFYKEGYNDIQIAKFLGVGKSSIQSFRQKLNLSINYRNDNIDINPTQKELLIGTLLGDSYLKLSGKETATGMFAHSLKQEKYFTYKKNILGPLCSKTLYKTQERNGKFHDSVYTHFVSSTKLLPYYKAFYNDEKTLPNKQFIFDNFTDFSFAIWYGDDGSIESTGKCLSTNSFEENNQLFLQDLLKQKLDINTTLYGREKNKFSLYIPTSERDKVNSILYKYLFGVLDYKI